MASERTPEGKWVVYDAAGQRLERWPVDARPMIESGQFFEQPPGAEAPVESAPAEIVKEPTTAEYAPGVPLVVTRAEDAAPAAPVELPRGRRAKG